MENKDWIKKTFLKDKPVNFTSHPSYPIITPKNMKQKRTVLSNPKVSKETASKAKRAVKALRNVKVDTTLMFKVDSNYWKENLDKMTKEYAKLEYHEKMGFHKPIAGIDFYKKDGKSRGSFIIAKDGKIVYHTNKIWAVKLLIKIAKFLGIKILLENNEIKKEI